jgi:hypothetical protein
MAECHLTECCHAVFQILTSVIMLIVLTLIFFALSTVELPIIVLSTIKLKVSMLNVMEEDQP